MTRTLQLRSTTRLRPRSTDCSVPPAGSRGSRRLALVAAALAAGALACAVNPATGRRELNLVSEEQEIAMGREADAQMQRELGVYDDAGLARLVEGLGSRMAAESERPELPWSFRLVDDPSVNAFALPGGFVYVTRGILAHLSSEAELAGVVGHEIGHVTARHSASQISRAQLAGLGIGIGAVAVPELEPWLGAAQAGLGLLFLKHGRDDEREADALGVRYTTRIGSSPEALLDVFEVLERVSAASGGGRLPDWLSTHPTPEDRTNRIREQLAEVPSDVRNAPRGGREYLQRLDGLVYGADPRKGFFEGPLFLHPELRFQLRFPRDWPARNESSSVSARSPEEDAVMVLRLAEGSSADQAAARFASQTGVRAGGSWISRVAAGPASSRVFEAETQEGVRLRGGAAFVELGGRVYSLVAYAAAERWSARERALRDAVASFDRLTDRRALEAQPQRLAITRLGRATSLEALNRSQPSSVPIEVLALLNRAEPGASLPAGTLVKRVVGEAR